jgi:FMN-dependent NADH-azoreductase
VARAGRTFKYGPNGPEGLVHGKKVIVLVATGGVYSAGPAAAYDHVTTYLRTVLGFLGMTDVSFIVAEGVAMGEEAVEAALSQSRNQPEAIAA